VIRVRSGRRPRHVNGEMNRTEAKFYDDYILPRIMRKEILWAQFEGITLRLGERCSWTPDFLVLLADGTLEALEVKGHWEDDARVKFKATASLFPWLTIRAFRPLPKHQGGGWDEEVLNPPEPS